MDDINAINAGQAKELLRKEGLWLLFASVVFFVYVLIRLSSYATTAGWLTVLSTFSPLPFIFIMLGVGYMIRRYRQDRSPIWTAQLAGAAIVSILLFSVINWQWETLTEHTTQLIIALLGAVLTTAPIGLLAGMKLVRSQDTKEAIQAPMKNL